MAITPSTHRVRKHRMVASLEQLVRNPSEGDDADDEGEEPGHQGEIGHLEDSDAGNEVPDSDADSSDDTGDEGEEPGHHGEIGHLEDSDAGNEVPDSDTDSSYEDKSEVITSYSEESDSDSSNSEGEYIDDIIPVMDEEPDEVRELRDLAVTRGMEQKTVDKMLKILRRRLLPELPKSAKTFLGTSSAAYEIKDMQSSDGSLGEYVYFGIEKGLQECIDPNVHTKSTIFVQFNVDGISLTKSGETCFWITSEKVHYQLDIYKPFAVMIYSGNYRQMV